MPRPIAKTGDHASAGATMNSQMDIEDTVRLLALKKAAIVMNALAAWRWQDSGHRSRSPLAHRR